MKITLRSPWAEIFPRKAKQTEKRRNWATWLRLARAAGASDQAKYWADSHECTGCAHKHGGWCTLQGLPCSVNPVLTPRTNMPGMACMGMGRRPTQLTLLLSSHHADQ